MQTAFTLPMQSFGLNENQDAVALAAISLGLRRRLRRFRHLRLGVCGISNGLGQHLAQLSLGLIRFAAWGLPFGHEQHVGMPEVKLNPSSPDSTLLFVVGLRRFPSQALSLQSFVIFPEGFLLSFVFRCCFRLVTKSPSSLSLREVLTCSIAHRSPPIQ
jgi:hypothetical protein